MSVLRGFSLKGFVERGRGEFFSYLGCSDFSFFSGLDTDNRDFIFDEDNVRAIVGFFEVEDEAESSVDVAVETREDSKVRGSLRSSPSEPERESCVVEASLRSEGE